MAQSANPKPNTFGAVLKRVQGMMGDRTGRWVTLGYSLEFINQAYDDIKSNIRIATGKNLEAILEVLNVPGGVSSLYPYQVWGDPDADPPVNRGPLFGLYDPLRLWVKTAGSLPQYYTMARGPRDTLPHVNPPGITPGTYAVQVTFAWIGNKLAITPVAGAIDIQVYGRFNPPPLQALDDELVIYPDLTGPLAYATCSLMGVERSNPSVLTGYIERGGATVDNVVADLILQQQKNPRRLAKMGGCGSVGSNGIWGWG